MSGDDPMDEWIARDAEKTALSKAIINMEDMAWLYSDEKIKRAEAIAEIISEMIDRRIERLR